MQGTQRIYLDNSAATAVDSRVLEAMEPYWNADFGNAGGLHTEGRIASETLANAHASLARSIDAHPDEIVFTSGGTESNNMAVLGAVRALLRDGTKAEEIHVITTAVEHSSITDCFHILERDGVSVTYLQVDEDGFVKKQELQDALRPETVLASFIYVNNEIGTIEHIKELTSLVHKQNSNHGVEYPLVHTDASQAPAWLHVNTQSLGIDLLTLDSQKLYGPKGVGCLYVRDKTLLEPIVYGGGQEFGLRPGTVPIPHVVGFAKALELVEEERDSYVLGIAAIRNRFIDRLAEEMPEAMINGPLGDERTAGNINVSFFDVDGDQLVIELDEKGIAASTASACDVTREGGSRVVQALGKYTDRKVGTVRFSMGRHTTQEEMDTVFTALKKTVTWLQNNAKA